MKKMLLFFALAGILAAGQANETAPVLTKEETLAACAADLKSPDVEVRRRAALVAGKYSSPEALRVLIQCFGDTDSGVRQSALVSIMEFQRIPVEVRPWIFRFLLDENVHIRRMASALLPEILGIRLQTADLMRADSGNLVQFSRIDDEGAVKYMNKALQDQDGAVRKNVLEASLYLSNPMDREVLESLFKDPEPQVRAMALRAYSRISGNLQERKQALIPMVDDKDARVALELVRTAACLNSEGADILKHLINSDNIDVSVQALSHYASLRLPGAYSMLKAHIDDDTCPADKRALLCRKLLYFMDEAKEYLMQLALSNQPAVKKEAVRCLTMNRSVVLPLDFLLALVDSDDDFIRRQIHGAFRRSAVKTGIRELEMLLKQTHPDTRLLALELMGNSADRSPEIGSLAVEACLDEDTGVRIAAIRTLTVLMPEGWLDILTASLEDEEPAIQSAAASALYSLKPTAAIQEALRNYLPRCRNDNLIRRINSYLRRKPQM